MAIDDNWTMARPAVSTTAGGIAAQCWNGPICSTCGTKYLGSHTCSAADIARRIRELTLLLEGLTAPAAPAPSRLDFPTDRMAHCPCRRENGGSGVCGCTLGGPQVTC